MDITLNDVSFMYDSKAVLKNTSFKFDEDFYLLEGHNGIGKTTVLNLLFKLISPTNGNIFIGQQNINDINRKNIKKLISYVRQDVFLFENLTIEENISLFLSKDEKLECIENVKKNLTKNLKKKVKKLSGGEKKMLDLFITLSKKSEIYLLDEPFNNLSLKKSLIIISFIMKLKGIVIMIDHTGIIKEYIKVKKVYLNLGVLEYEKN